MTAPKSKEEAIAFLRGLLETNIPREIFERVYLDKAGKPQEQIDAELMEFARKIVDLWRAQRGADGWPADSVCTAFPYMFVDMIREHVRMMQAGTV